MKDKKLLALLAIFSLNSIYANNNLYLHDAVEAKNNELIKLHIKNGANVNETDTYNQTPLHLAASNNSFEIVKTLIENNASLDLIDSYGDTALIDAARNNDTNISKELICNGADTKIKGQFGLDALNYSTINDNLKISKLILSQDLENDCKEEIITQEINTTTQNNESIPEELLISNDELSLLKGDETQEEASFDDLATLESNPTSNLTQAITSEFSNDYLVFFDANTLSFNFSNSEFYFANGSYELTPEFKILLNDFIPRLARVLSNFENEIQNIIFKGSSSPKYDSLNDEVLKYEKNIELSNNRAKSVLEYLDSQEGINTNTDFLKIRDKIKFDATVDDSFYAEEAMARRVDIILNK